MAHCSPGDSDFINVPAPEQAAFKPSVDFASYTARPRDALPLCRETSV